MSALLQQLELAPDKRGRAPLAGLVSVKDDTIKPQSIAEHVARREAGLLTGTKESDIPGIDYIFFRRFNDGRSPQVCAYVVDNSANRYTRDAVADLHRRVWLNGTAPLLYVEWPTQVDVLRCAAGPDFWNSRKQAATYKEFDSIKIASEVSHALEAAQQVRYSAFRLAEGTFWEDPENAEWAHADQAAHKRLLQAVIETDRALSKETEPAARPAMRRLLLLFIFTKYLEDREVFPSGWFAGFVPKVETFLDVLQSGKVAAVREMLAKLKERFNGDIFEIPEVEHSLSRAVLLEFTELLHAKTLGKQRYLWEQFSFRYIPVEVLSHIYQHFAQEGKGAIYTPPFVADLILDYALPYESMTGCEKVLDPTCGSGIFLVGAFRRLTHFWQNQNSWKPFRARQLKEILRGSIYGVEDLPEAAQVAALNLALAVCEALHPKVIWNELKFDRLIGRNLFVGDFFHHQENLRKNIPEGFSCIVGNPPFASELTETAVASRPEALRDIPIPDRNIGYAVLETAPALLSENARLCLLQPSGILYNAKPQKFAARILRSHTVEAVLDFVSIRKLFEAADTKAVALLMRKQAPEENHHIQHITFRRTKGVHERIGFELDHYDVHEVSLDFATQNPWVWKTNLLGGGRLVHLTEKVMKWPTLKEFLDEKRWTHGEGYIEGKNEARKQNCTSLEGAPFLPTDALGNKGIEQNKIERVKNCKVVYCPPPERFKAPMFLIAENDALHCAFVAEGDLAFLHSIVSVNAPANQKAEIGAFAEQFEKLKSKLRVFALIKSTRSLIGKSTSILKKDIDELPWPKAGGFSKIAWWEDILLSDAAHYHAPLIRVGQESDALSKQAHTQELISYSDTFIKLLGSVYPTLRAGTGGLADGMAYQSFIFGKECNLDWGDDWAERLRTIVFKQNSDTLQTRRILRFYEGNTLIIVKPDRLRHWIRSTAIRDADETLVDLLEQDS
jgi:hypothetical protein